MTIATLPTRNPADLGAALYDARTPNANELAAVNIEKIKDRLIEVVTEVGLTSGATAGSINAMRAAFTAGAYDAILRWSGSAYGSQRIGGSLGAPTVADDSAQGYAPGSWWVQTFGLDNPATLAFWLCTDASPGAAVWVQIGAPPTTTTRSITADDAITENDDFLFVTTASAAVELSLPAPSAGLVFAIKKTNEGTYPISLEPDGSESIEGGTGGAAFTLPSSDLALRCSWTIVCDGADWWLV
jgi:hypothetical protein